MVRDRPIRNIILAIANIYTVQDGKPKTAGRRSITVVKDAEKITFAKNFIQ
jgi:hypothetical protein